MVNLVQDQVVKEKRYTSGPKTVFMTGSQHFSPGDIQFQLVYHRVQCAESIYFELKFGVKGNFGLLISNLSSEMQHQHKILRKIPLCFSSIMIFSPAIPHELVTMATRNDLSSVF